MRSLILSAALFAFSGAAQAVRTEARLAPKVWLGDMKVASVTLQDGGDSARVALVKADHGCQPGPCSFGRPSTGSCPFGSCGSGCCQAEFLDLDFSDKKDRMFFNIFTQAAASCSATVSLTFDEGVMNTVSLKHGEGCMGGCSGGGCGPIPPVVEKP